MQDKFLFFNIFQETQIIKHCVLNIIFTLQTLYKNAKKHILILPIHIREMFWFARNRLRE